MGDGPWWSGPVASIWCCCPPAGRTPLHAAAAAGQVASVEELVQQGAAVNARDLTAQLTPLHVAAEYGYGAVAAKLLELGAALEATTDQGHTPLSLAVSKVGCLPMLLMPASSCYTVCMPACGGPASPTGLSGFLSPHACLPGAAVALQLASTPSPAKLNILTSMSEAW